MTHPLTERDLVGWRALRLWAGWAMGPAAWALHESGGYAILPAVCAGGSAWPLHALLVATLALALVGALISWSFLHRLRAGGVPGPVASRSRFILLVGLGLCLGAVFGIVAEALATWTLDPCAGA